MLARTAAWRRVLRRAGVKELEERLRKLEEQQMFDQRFGEELHEQVVELMRAAQGLDRRLIALERRLAELAAGDAGEDGAGSAEE